MAHDPQKIIKAIRSRLTGLAKLRAETEATGRAIDKAMDGAAEQSAQNIEKTRSRALVDGTAADRYLDAVRDRGLLQR